MVLRVLDSRRKFPWCNVCDRKRESLDCFLPYGTRSGITRSGRGQYHCCCRTCREAILTHPQEYMTNTTDIRQIAFCDGLRAIAGAIEGGV
jgi:hypothetical protein